MRFRSVGVLVLAALMSLSGELLAASCEYNINVENDTSDDSDVEVGDIVLKLQKGSGWTSYDIETGSVEISPGLSKKWSKSVSPTAFVFCYDYKITYSYKCAGANSWEDTVTTSEEGAEAAGDTTDYYITISGACA